MEDSTAEKLIHRALCVISQIKYLKHGNSEYQNSHTHPIELFSSWIDEKELELKKLAEESRKSKEVVHTLLNDIMSSDESTISWMTSNNTLKELIVAIVPRDILNTFVINKQHIDVNESLSQIDNGTLLEFLKSQIQMLGISHILITNWNEIWEVIKKND